MISQRQNKIYSN